MERKAPKVLVLIQPDPMKTHRAVEALRIAVGLGSHNEGCDLTVILSGRSPFLLSEDTSAVIDAEILEKYLPTLIEWRIPFAVANHAETPPQFAPNVITKPITDSEIVSALESADLVLVF